jgi:Asp-tRNA(Asn)/Glu-tRNA(Gln) amidotransferase A subunit family amidase
MDWQRESDLVFLQIVMPKKESKEDKESESEQDGVRLPVGVQFMSPKRTEASLFAVARDVMDEA